jgi:hypothetical protein
MKLLATTSNATVIALLRTLAGAGAGSRVSDLARDLRLIYGVELLGEELLLCH